MRVACRPFYGDDAEITTRTASFPQGGRVKALLASRPARLVSVALANKMARLVWALLVSGNTYRAPVATVTTT
jgi:hypothetical protein